MSTRIRNEEYPALGDFIKVSFVRDQSVIADRFPKLNEIFLAAFTAKLDEVKTLESRIVVTEAQKDATASLYLEAGVLNKELNFLSSYFSEAGLNSGLVTALKDDLFKNNIEGAILKIEGVKQFVVSHQVALEEEGMVSTFPDKLEAHKVSLAAKNALQNSFMNSGATLTSDNTGTHAELYAYIQKIAKAGKLVFDGSVVKEEYSITKTISRMRAAKKNGGITPLVA